MGLPIVTTDVPGCKEVVEQGVNGYLVPGQDAAALAQAILHLAGDPDLRRRFGEQSRRRAVTLFDLSVVAGQTRSLYQELLVRKVPAPGVAV